MKLFNLIKRVIPYTYGGYIRLYKLQDFWSNLSKEERALVRSWGTQATSENKIDSPFSNISYSSRSPSMFLCVYSGWAISDKKYDLAEKMLNESLSHNPNIIDLHFIYVQLMFGDDICNLVKNAFEYYLENDLEIDTNRLVNNSVAFVQSFWNLHK